MSEWESIHIEFKSIQKALDTFANALQETMMSFEIANEQALRILAMECEIQAGWTPWVARLRVRGMDLEEVVKIVEKNAGKY